MENAAAQMYHDTAAPLASRQSQKNGDAVKVFTKKSEVLMLTTEVAGYRILGNRLAASRTRA